jgi:protocatechuate 3,4-dioxygenase beta subunit
MHILFKTKPLWICSILLASSCHAQTPAEVKNLPTGSSVGGPCDGCEIMYSGMPAKINSTDTSAGWFEAGQKLLVTGKVYRADKKTPAPDVILYYWQTDDKGYYSPQPGKAGQSTRHGHIRGWMKTNLEGNFALYTIRPTPYPGEKIAAHIHILVKEPGLANEYYIDELVFDDDPLLTASTRNQMENRGGSGILRVQKKGSLLVANHDIVLGLNIPGYPETVNKH